MANDEGSTSPSLSPRRRVGGIADVPLIACQSGATSDSTTSSLENFHLASLDGTTNPAYHSSPSDSDRSTSQDCDGETESAPTRGTRRLSRSPRVSSAQKPVSILPVDSQNKDTLSDSWVQASANGSGTYTELGSTESAESCLDRPLPENMAYGCDSTPHQHTSKPIGAKLVVTYPALNQQNSVRVPAPLPHTCTSVLPNSTTSSYSDSELIPQRNSVSHGVTEMVATEHLVTRQRLELPQVFPVSSNDMSEEQVPSLTKRKTLAAEQRRQNRAAIQTRLHQLHLQRSLSAGNTPGSRHPLPDGASTGGSKPRSGRHSRHLNHSVLSSGSVPVHGNADVAGVTPDSLLPPSSSLPPSNLSTDSSSSATNNFSGTIPTDDTTVPENSFTDVANIQTAAVNDTDLGNVQTEDGVFDEESSSAVIIDVQPTQSSDLSASTLADSSEHHTGSGVPNRAILRRGSGEWCSVLVDCNKHWLLPSVSSSSVEA